LRAAKTVIALDNQSDSAMTQTLTIQLSETTYDQLKRAAELTHQSVDAVVEQSLLGGLPSLLEEIPPAYQPDVYPLLRMSEAELRAEAQRWFPAERWAEYEQLLEQKRVSPLSDPAQARLDVLRHEADILTFRKGYAAVLLKRRGYAPPTLAELSQAA
jgi:hypothetical protein